MDQNRVLRVPVQRLRREDEMEFRTFKTIFLIALCACLTACSGVTPKTTPPISESNITEEDVTDNRSLRSNPDVPGQQPAFSGPPAPPVEESPGVEPGSRQPRRIFWRDQKGTDKGAKFHENTGGREP